MGETMVTLHWCPDFDRTNPPRCSAHPTRRALYELRVGYAVVRTACTEACGKNQKVRFLANYIDACPLSCECEGGEE